MTAVTTMRRRDAMIVIGAAAFLASVAWLLGFVTAFFQTPPGPPVPENVEPPSGFGVYGEVWGHVRREFYGQRPPSTDVTRGSIEGLLESLDDPYAAIVDRETLDEDPGLFAPRFVTTLGAWVDPVVNGWLVLSVLPDSPASEGELLPTDVIVAVDGEPVVGLDPDLELAMSGDQEDVELAISGDGEDSTPMLFVLSPDVPARYVEVELGTVKPPAVEYRIARDGVAYLRIPHFGSGVVGDLDTALVDLGKEPHRGLVLDLRDNPGGDLDTLRAVAGRFLSGPLWVEVGGDGVETMVDAGDGGASDYDLPTSVAVVVNAGTAGSAEILAGAIRDAHGAHLVGVATFGKSAVQDLFTLSDGSLLRLSTAQWQTLSGTQIEEVGLVPDREVDDEGDQVEAAIDLVSGTTTAGG